MSTSTASWRIAPRDSAQLSFCTVQGSLILADVAGLLLSVILSLFCKYLVSGDLNLYSYIRLWPFAFVFLLVYWLIGLYSDVALSAPEELRRTTLSTIAIFVALAAITVSLRGASSYFTWTLFLAVSFTLFFVPLLRAIVRRSLAGKHWWGYQAVVLGGGSTGRNIIRTLRSEPGLGFKPIAVLDADPSLPRFIEGVPVYRSVHGTLDTLLHPSRRYTVIATSRNSDAEVSSLMTRLGANLSRVLVIPDSSPLYSGLLLSPKSVGGIWGWEVTHAELNRRQQWLKRALDLTLVALAIPVLLPLVAVIAACIRLDSKGSPVYGHRRIGRDGKFFRAWKFRSMVINGDEVLAEHLRDNPEARAEWEESFKLRNDPRVTRVGKFLRRTSLDELPQLWNVLMGEMSLVGPRPIVEAEIERYGEHFDLYARVMGGVTGLWQVSGRSNVSYEERVRLDSFYVRNWSIWMDLCILVRTVEVVLLRKGAY